MMPTLRECRMMKKNQADEPKDAGSKVRNARITPRYANKV